MYYIIVLYICRTPLHCAASCNNLAMVEFLVEYGACIFATTISDHETAAEKCEEDEDGFDGCSQYLYGISDKIIQPFALKKLLLIIRLNENYQL